jgi:hypothetical protein
MGSAAKAEDAGEIRSGAGEIRFGFPDINIPSVALLTVVTTLSAIFTIRLILGPINGILNSDNILIISTN